MKSIKLFLLTVIGFFFLQQDARAACNTSAITNINYITSSSFLVNWQIKSNIIGYQLTYDTTNAPNFNNIINLSNAVDTHTISGLICGVRYYAFLRVVCAVGDTSAWTSYSATTYKCCNPPTPISYPFITQTQVRIDITPVNNVDYYEYIIDSNLTTPTQSTSGNKISPFTTVTLPVLPQRLEPYTLYKVCFRTICSSGDPFSVWHCDTIRTKPFCKQVSTISAQYAGSTNRLMSWDSIPHARKYDYYLNTNINPPSTGWQSTQKTEALITNLTPLTKYYFCVSSVCDSLGGRITQYCDSLSIPLSVSSISKNSTKLNIYPNPANKTVHIDMDSKFTRGEVLLFNLLGEVVLKEQVVGKNATLQVEHLPRGVYILNYSNNLTSKQYKLVLQ